MNKDLMNASLTRDVGNCDVGSVSDDEWCVAENANGEGNDMEHEGGLKADGVAGTAGGTTAGLRQEPTGRDQAAEEPASPSSVRSGAADECSSTEEHAGKQNGSEQTALSAYAAPSNSPRARGICHVPRSSSPRGREWCRGRIVEGLLSCVVTSVCKRRTFNSGVTLSGVEFKREEREAYYRHKFLADTEKALRPTNPDIPEDTEIADVEPISVQYHLRSNLDLFNQYDINIDRMPRTKHTSYQREVGESSKPSVDEEVVDPGHEASDIREEDIQSVEHSLERQESGGESIGNEDDAEGSEKLGEGEDDEEEDDETDEEIAANFNLAAQIAEEKRLDEEYDSDQDDPKYLEPQEIPNSYEINECVVDPVWLQTATEKDYCQHGKRFYRLPDGYELRLPGEGQTTLDCPPGHIVVYAKHFEFGLRFPLHHYIEKIFRAWNVSISQLTPPTIRNIVYLVWVMIFMDFPLTLNLFRRLHWIKRDSQSPGWWSLFTAPGKCTVWPKLTSCKNWKTEFYLMSVPEDFTIRRRFHHPHSMFETIRSRALGKMEKKAFKWFNCTYVSAGKKNKVVPGVWLPHCNYILGNAPLSHVGLCHTDAFGIDKLDFNRLGLHSDGRVKQQCPDRPKKSYDTLPVFATRASKRKRTRQQDMAPTERVTKPRTLAVKRGGGNASKRTSESSDRKPQKKQKKHDGDAAPLYQEAQKTWPEGVVNLEDETDPHPAKKLTVTLRDPKGLRVSSEVRTGQMASIEKPPSKETTVVSGRTGGPNKNVFVSALVGDFIEIPRVRIPEEVAEELAVPFGAAGDPWHPRINVNRGESESWGVRSQ
uniref:Transposase (putative) gypsy type domain-containing protein n=1 Tax=Chenopodium quinoa TaxID=63459 RepID=A0A803LK22_CHEQI